MQIFLGAVFSRDSATPYQPTSFNFNHKTNKKVSNENIPKLQDISHQKHEQQYCTSTYHDHYLRYAPKGY